MPSCGRNWRSLFPPSSGDQKPESGCGVGHAPPHSPCPPPAPTGSRSPRASPWVVAAPTPAPAASAPGLPPTALRPPTRTPVTWAGAAPGALAGPLPLRCPGCRTVAFRGAGVRASASVLDSQLSPRHLPAGVVLAAVWPSAGRLWWGGRGARVPAQSRGLRGLLLRAACGAIAFRGLCVDVTASSLLRNLHSENNCYRINCVDNLLILLSTLFAFKLKVLLANLTCLLQEAFRLN